jgi:putative membrane protein
MPVDKRYASSLSKQVVQAAESELDEALELAFTRTELASDRTLLAWIRTALTLMAAGIAYDKGFRLLHERRLAEGTAWVTSAHFAGVLVTIASTLLLAMATVRHLVLCRHLAGARSKSLGWAMPSLLGAMLVIGLGCAVAVILITTR